MAFSLELPYHSHTQSKRSDKSMSLGNPQTNHITTTTITTKVKHKDLYSNDDDYGMDDDDAVYHVKQCYQSVPKTQEQTQQQQQRRRRTRQCRPSIIVSSSKNPCHQSFITSPLSSSPPPQPSMTTNLFPTFSCCISIGGSGLAMSSWWRQCLLIATILLLFHAPFNTLAAPQSCILCDKNDLQSKDPQTNYEEFLFEHQVTRQDAINALKQLNESFYDGLQSDSSCNAVRCTEKVSKYCLGPLFINDHCYCEFGHSTEGLPFVPHMCYVGEKAYKPSVGSCFVYEEVKECCCSALLAREWRHISSSPSLYHSSSTIFSNYHDILLITCLYLLIRQLYF
ncbi:uncharacterized protein [Musca autumnalis]|uniref:uncharacterized protein n=1 Tax=Musca autumnalis TaxID=221902 RepID=UPI003CED2285